MLHPLRSAVNHGKETKAENPLLPIFMDSDSERGASDSQAARRPLSASKTGS